MRASAIDAAMTLVDAVVLVYSVIILMYILTSWVPLPYNRTLNRLRRFLFDACEPYLRLFRRIIPPLGAFDLSPVVAVTALWLAGWAINSVLAHFG